MALLFSDNFTIFSIWVITTDLQYVFALALVLILSSSVHAIQRVLDKLLKHIEIIDQFVRNEDHYNSEMRTKYTTLDEESNIHLSLFYHRLSFALLCGLQKAISMFLILVIVSYNAGLFISVILGHMIGYSLYVYIS